MTPSPPPAWTRRVVDCFFGLWLLKAVGTTAFMVLFFHAYFWVLKNPSTEAFELPLMAPDHWVPFTPAAIYAYGWLWVYVSVAPGLVPRPRMVDPRLYPGGRGRSSHARRGGGASSPRHHATP